MSFDDRDFDRVGFRDDATVCSGVAWPKGRQSRGLGSWHPVLQILFFAAVCLGVFLLLRLFSH